MAVSRVFISWFAGCQRVKALRKMGDLGERLQGARPMGNG
jgi:hypothetical protein